MIFIFGLKDHKKEIASGRFNCPACGISRPYKRYQIGQYFSLYFIPVFRIKDLGESIQCQGCQRNFQTQVLDNPLPAAVDPESQAIRQELASGLPLHMMVQKLVIQGMALTLAQEKVNQAAGGNSVICPACKFTYLEGTKRCINCGTILLE